MKEFSRAFGNYPPMTKSEEERAPWNQEEDDSIRMDDIRDEIMYLMQKAGYLVESTDDRGLYFPEAATIVEFVDA